MDNVVINIEANPEGLITTIDLLEKLGQIDAATAAKFKADTASYVLALSQRKQATQELGSAAQNSPVNNPVPDKTIKSYSTLKEGVTGLKGNILILNGVMGLMGDKFEGIQTLVLKLHSGLLLVKGVKAFSGLGESAAEGAVGINTLTAAMAANPIGAVLVAVAALTAAFLIFRNNADESTDAIDRMNNVLAYQEDVLNALKRLNDEYDTSLKDRVELLKAQGKTGAEVFDAEKTVRENRIKDIDSENRTLQSQFDELVDNRSKNLKDVTVKSEDQKKIEEGLFNKQKEIADRLKAIPAERKHAEAELNIFLEQSKTDEIKSTKEQNEKLRKLFEERQKEIKEAAYKLAQLNINSIENENDKARAQLIFNYNKDIDALADQVDKKIIKYEQFSKAVIDIQNKLNNELKKIEENRIDIIDPLASKTDLKGADKSKAQLASAQKDLELLKKSLQEQKDMRIKIAEELYSKLSKLAEDFINTEFENQLRAAEDLRDLQQSQFDEKIQANQEARDKERITEREYQATNKSLLDQKHKAELEAQKKINDLKHKQDIANRNARLFEIAIDTARNAIQQPGLFGALIPYWIGLGIAQAAIVAAAPLPKYHSGKRAKTNIGEHMAIIRDDEDVMSPQKSKSYRATLDAIHNGRVPSLALNDFVKNFKMKDFVGGRSININMDADKFGSAIEWHTRTQNKAVTKRLERIEQAILSGRITQADLRRA